jgi:Protein of unknown function (DUF3592)
MGSSGTPDAPERWDEPTAWERVRRGLGRIALIGFAVALVIIIPVTIWRDVSTTVHRYHLDRDGVPATARVDRVDIHDLDADAPTYFATVTFEGVTTTVEVGSPDHAAGSPLAIRYEPGAPTDAIATEDPPVFVGVGAWFLVVGAIGCVVAATTAIRRARHRRREGDPARRGRDRATPWAR